MGRAKINPEPQLLKSKLKVLKYWADSVKIIFRSQKISFEVIENSITPELVVFKVDDSKLVRAIFLIEREIMGMHLTDKYDEYLYHSGLTRTYPKSLLEPSK